MSLAEAQGLFRRHSDEGKLDYIHNNPGRAGIVEKPEDYLYSNAGNYAVLKSVIEIDLL